VSKSSKILDRGLRAEICPFEAGLRKVFDAWGLGAHSLPENVDGIGFACLYLL
jgi:hypothetical protein